MTLLMFRAGLIFQSIICQELEIIKMCNIVINIIFIFQFFMHSYSYIVIG